ncbi:MAG: class I SAM-dependent methyltransferase [Candidatus Sumerlaeia bacterium]
MAEARNPHNEEASMRVFFDDCVERGVLLEFSPEEEAKLPQMFSAWNIQKGDRLFEPGCGSGRLTRLLPERVGPEGEVLAMDLSPRMITEAQKRGMPENVEAVVGSIYHIPREDDWFDKILCFCAFPHFTEPAAALAEMTRVLKPGGDFFVNHFVGSHVINDFHRKAGSAVEHHRLPIGHEWRDLLENCRLEMLEFIDRDDLFHLHAKLRKG